MVVLTVKMVDYILRFGFRIMFVVYLGIRYIEVLFHTFYCNFGRDVEYRSLYQGLR